MCLSNEKPATSNDPQPQPGKAETVNHLRGSPRRRKEFCCPRSRSLPWTATAANGSLASSAFPSERSITGCRRCGRSGPPTWPKAHALMMAVALARLDSIYREAMDEWCQSRRDIEVRVVENTEAAGGDPKKKSSVRTQPQRRNAALLAKAAGAVMASCRLTGLLRLETGRPRARAVAPIRSQTSQGTTIGIRGPRSRRARDGWASTGFWVRTCSRRMIAMSRMDEDDLREVAWRLRTVIRANGGSIPVALRDRQMDFPSPYELQIERAHLLAAINALPPLEDLPEDEESLPADSWRKEQT